MASRCARGRVGSAGHPLALGPPEQQQVRPRVDDRPSALLGVVERADHLDHARSGAPARQATPPRAARARGGSRRRSRQSPSTALGQKRKPRSCVVGCAARGRSRSVTAAARVVLAGEPELPGDEAARPRQAGQRGVLGVERREQLPAAVLAGDVRSSPSQRRRSGARARSARSQAHASTSSVSPSRPVTRTRSPRLRALVACARQSSPCTRTYPTGPALLRDLDHPADQRLGADLGRAPRASARARRRSARSRTRPCRSSRAIAQPPSTTCEDDEREGDPEGHRAPRGEGRARRRPGG